MYVVGLQVSAGSSILIFDRSLKKFFKFYIIRKRNIDLSVFNVSLQKLSAIKFSQVLLEPNVTKVLTLRNSVGLAAHLRSIQLLITSITSYANPRADGFFVLTRRALSSLAYMKCVQHVISFMSTFSSR